MKPAAFRYLAPRSEDELIAILREYGGEARLLAGGQSLVPMMNFRIVSPAVLVDINRIRELAFLNLDEAGIELGALTRHVVLEDSAHDEGAVFPARRGASGTLRIAPCATAGPWAEASRSPTRAPSFR